MGIFVHYGPPDATSLREYAALPISSPKTGRSDPAFNRSARIVKSISQAGMTGSVEPEAGIIYRRKEPSAFH
jgi:hypothetical protein